MGIEKFKSLEMTPSMTHEEFDEKTKGYHIDHPYAEALEMTKKSIAKGYKSLWFALKIKET